MRLRYRTVRLKQFLAEAMRQVASVNRSDRPWEMPVAAALASGLPIFIGAAWGELGLGLVGSLGGLVFLHLPATRPQAARRRSEARPYPQPADPPQNAGMNATRMPAVFVGHGSPMNTLESNRFTVAWRALGASMPRPRAILAISAHWYVPSTAVTAMARPPVIHDFYGFPPALSAFDYPAPGAPDVAQEVADTLAPAYAGMDHDSWGIDHGTWSVLAHMYPDADIPVVQLSVHSGESFEYHLDIGRRLAPLRDRGILILGSGNVVHNLRRIDFRRPDLAFDWGLRFDAAVKAAMTTQPAALAAIGTHPDYALSVPTPEHFLPLAYLCGLCDAAGEAATPFNEGGTLGSITMTGYLLGWRAPASEAGDGAAPLPDPGVVPPDQTNT